MYVRSCFRSINNRHGWKKKQLEVPPQQACTALTNLNVLDLLTTALRQ